MNCKPGDMAVIVDAPAESNALGRIVTVLRAADYEPIYTAKDARHQSSVKWKVRAQEPLIVKLGKKPHVCREFIAPDSALRPIRPGDISDEEVRDLYAPKTKETA